MFTHSAAIARTKFACLPFNGRIQVMEPPEARMLPSKYGKASGDINDVMEPIQPHTGRPVWVPGEYARTDDT